MHRFGIMLFSSLQMLAVSARAESLSIEPGQWKVTATTAINGGSMPPKVTMRCLSPEQAGDVTKTLGPEMGTVNSTCGPTQFETKIGQMKWQLLCRGQIDIDLVANYTFDSRSHYTATVISKGWMAGALMSDVRTELEGERTGECQP
jgi:hypothetical protein